MDDRGINSLMLMEYLVMRKNTAEVTSKLQFTTNDGSLCNFGLKLALSVNI